MGLRSPGPAGGMYYLGGGLHNSQKSIVSLPEQHKSMPHINLFFCRDRFQFFAFLWTWLCRVSRFFL